jgi:hypothetical protein
MFGARSLPVVCASLCLTAAGCGGGGSSSSSTPSNSTTAAATASKPAVDLRPLLLKDNALPGYHRARQPMATTDVQRWATLTQDDPGRLRQLGFVAGARADLANASAQPGLTLVERFKTAAAARKEIAFLIALNGGPKEVRRFRVPGIPDAYGFASGRAGGGRNIAFSKGADYFVVGFVQGGGAPSIKELITTAQKQYADAP